MSTVKVLVTGTGKDGTYTTWDLIRQAFALNGVEARVEHEPDVFPIVNAYTRYLETGDDSHQGQIVDILSQWEIDVAVSGALDFCLDLIWKVFGSQLKVIHLKRKKDAYVQSVIHSTLANTESHGNYLTTEETYRLYRPAAFHYGEMTKEEWTRLSLKDKYAWYYDKIHSMHDKGIKQFENSLSIKTEDLSKQETIAKIVRFIEPEWKRVPPPTHRNAMRLIDHQMFPLEYRKKLHNRFVGFDVEQFMRSDLYPVNYFFSFINLEEALKTNDPELKELIQHLENVKNYLTQCQAHAFAP